MTREQLKTLFSNASESFIKRNSDLGAGEAAKREPRAKPALERDVPTQQKGSDSVAIIVSIVAVRRTLLDCDNNVGSAKHLRDCISRTLQCDDGDPRIKWQYGQLLSAGREGAIVRIEKL